MKIADLEFLLVEILQPPPLAPVRSLLVRLATDDGTEGWGEAPSSFPPSPLAEEGPAPMVRGVRGRCAGLAWRPSELGPRRDALLPVLAGRNVFDIEELHTLEALSHPALRAGLETACWDVLGRATGQPLCRLWGGEYRRRIPLAARLSGGSPDRLAQEAHELADQGFHTQIVTTSASADLDRQMLRSVRESAGDRISLRLDCQGAYTLEAARDLAAAIEYDRSEFLLDPLETRELYPVANLGRQVSVPLAVGRAIRNPADVLAVVRCGAASHMVVDIAQVGGISPARSCAAITAAAGLSMVLGGRPSLGIATAAMLHLAAATRILSGANESAYHQLRHDVLTEPLELVDGMMTVPQSPGLGIDVDRAKVERYAVA
jgi:L-alanine-DL-glutamate epimerase-like enolase superfamily enzyme